MEPNTTTIDTPTITRPSPRKVCSLIGLALFAMILVWIGGSVLGSFILASASPDLLKSPLVVFLLNDLPLYCLGLPIFLLVLKIIPDIPLREEDKQKKAFGPGQLIMLFVFCMGLNYLIGIVNNIFIILIEQMLGHSITDSISSMIENSNHLLNFIFIGIVPALGEEFLFRYTLRRKLRGAGDKIFIFISALTFSMFHANILQIPYAFAVGLVLAWVYAYTNRIIYSILLHFILNFMSAVVSVWVLDNQVLTIIYTLVVLLCLIAAFPIFFIHLKMVRNSLKPPHEPDWPYKGPQLPIQYNNPWNQAYPSITYYQGAFQYGSPFHPNSQSYAQSIPSYGHPSAPYGQPAAPYGQPAAPYGQPAAPYGQPAAPYGQPAAPYGQPAAPYGQPSAPYGQPSAPHGQPAAPYGQSSAPYGQPSAPHGQPAAPYGQSSAPYGQSSAPYGQPAAPYGQSAAPYGQPAAPYGQPAAPYGQPSTPYGQPSAPYGQSSAPYGQPAAPYGQPSAPYGQPSVPYGQPAAPYGQPAAPYGQPAAPYGQPSASYGQPAAPYGQPAASYGQPAAPYGQPAAPYEQPTAPYGQPAAPYIQPPPPYEQPQTNGLHWVQGYNKQGVPYYQQIRTNSQGLGMFGISLGNVGMVLYLVAAIALTILTFVSM